MKKFLTSIIVVVLLLSVVCGCVACSKETSFDKVVKCAKDMQDWAPSEENFQSFEIYDECGYRVGYRDYPFTVFIYVPFKITYTDGDYWVDVAYYVNGDFIGYYSDFEDDYYETKLEDPEDQIYYLCSHLIFLGDEAKEKFSKDEVNIALGIGTASEDAATAAE